MRIEIQGNVINITYLLITFWRHMKKHRLMANHSFAAPEPVVARAWRNQGLAQPEPGAGSNG
jgi:hypothetical protein